MIVPVPVRRHPPMLQPASLHALSLRREALLVRIGAAREDTAEAGRLLAADLRAGERMQRSFLGVLKLVKATLVVGGVIWSLKTLSPPSRPGRSRRLLTMAMGLLSTMRALRTIRAILLPPAPSTQNQG